MIIGGVTLDKDMYWDDEFQFTLGAGTAARTIYGNELVQSVRLSGGQPMTLEGTVGSGWQSRTTVQALVALAANPTAAFNVTLPDSRTFLVMFRNEDPPVVSFQKITPASAPSGDFWYYGTIKLRIMA